MQVRLVSSLDPRPLEPVLRFWIDRLKLAVTLEVRPPYQLFAQLLSESQAAVDLVVVGDDELAGHADELWELLRSHPRPCILAWLPHGPRSRPAVSGLTLLDLPGLRRRYGVTEIAAQTPERPYTEDFYAALGTELARALVGFLLEPIKAIVVDADNTLWTGAVGELGVKGVTVEPEHRALQAYLKLQVGKGRLLAVCSKNRLQDVEAVFREHAEMILSPADVAAWRVGWSPKSEQIRELALELGFAESALLVFDDDPVELAEIQSHLPDVLALQAPVQLDHLWMLPEGPATQEDGKRVQFYREEGARREAARQFCDLATFHAGLDLQVDFAPLSETELERASQLTHRTTQFHLSPRGRSAAELRAVASIAVTARDRFGDYGLVGLIIAHPRSSTLEVETFLLSCRALARGVEHVMLNYLGDQGYSEIALAFTSTERNEPAALFLAEQLGRPAQDGNLCLSAEQARAAHWRPAQPRTPPGDAKSNRRAGYVLDRLALSEVCSQGWTANKVRALMRKVRPELTSPFQPPRGLTQSTVADVWCDVLAMDRVGVLDSFFELGGDSLGMIAVLARLRDRLGRSLTLEQMLSGATVERMAANLDSPPPEEVIVESLNDLEVEQLLACLEGPATIQAIAIPTCGRPRSLARAALSFHRNLVTYGRTCRLLVTDNGQGEQAEETRRCLQSLREEHGVKVEYWGPAELGGWRTRLVSAGISPRMVEWATGGGTGNSLGSGSRHGSAANIVQLVLAGIPFYSPDDDNLAGPAWTGRLDAPLQIRPGLEAEEYWLEEPAGEQVSQIDVIGHHERLLGRNVRDLLLAERSTGSSELHRRAQHEAAWVALTFHGQEGDCGWGPPFGLWEAPFGYLYLNDSSHRRLTRSEETYRRALLTRRMQRMAPEPSLGDGSGSLGMFYACDNRKLIPPWFPCFRGDDRLFPKMLWRCQPQAVFGHVPLALPHQPPKTRAFWPGEIFRNAKTVDVFQLVIELLGLWQGPSTPHAATAVRELGRHFEELGEMPGGDFAALAGQVLRERNNRFRDFVEGGRQEPEYWYRDLQTYLTRMQAAEASPNYWVPLDLTAEMSLERAKASMQESLRDYGQLLQVWPDLVAVAEQLAAERTVELV